MAKQTETPVHKERRLKARKYSYKSTYQKGIFYSIHKYQNLIDYLNQPDVLVRVINSGALNDDTEFLTITIEGFKEKEGGI